MTGLKCVTTRLGAAPSPLHRQDESQLNRRRILLAAACLICALEAPYLYAQSSKVYRIGLLETTAATANRANIEALLRGLHEAGYVEGKNLIIDYRSADGRSDRFPELARDLVRAKPDLIVTRGTPAAVAAKNAGAVPIVMTASGDPVGPGVVSNLAHPGGNVTGLAVMATDLIGKRIEILIEILPAAKRIGFVGNMANPTTTLQWKEVTRIARSLGLATQVYNVQRTEGLRGAFEQAVAQRCAVLLATGEAIIAANRTAIAHLAARHRMPVIYTQHEFVDAGGLISYGVDYPHLYYRAATYVDRILKGAKPGDLPIEQPTKLELAINLRAAKALGITIPQTLLLRADKVIE